MEGDFIKINEWLLPLSWLYGLGVRLRNFMFEVGLLKSHSFDVPVISVGNITVGGKEVSSEEFMKLKPKDLAAMTIYKAGSKEALKWTDRTDKNVIVVDKR